MTQTQGDLLSAPARLPRWRHYRALSWLALAGLVLEAVLALGLLKPLSLLRLPAIINSPRPMIVAFGQGWGGALRLIVPVVLAFVVLAIACRLARAGSGRSGRRLVFGFAALYVLTLVPINPVGAHDVYHNIADARTLWLYGENPMVTPPAAHPYDPWFRHVISWKNTPSVYGPLWYAVSGLPLLLHSTNLWENVIAHKLLTAAFLLATMWLAMRIAAREAPEHTLAAGILIGWNPLLLFETAGNAHNGILMMFFTLLVIDAASRRRWIAVFPLLALAVASKYVMAVLGPVLLLWMLRQPGVSRRRVALSLGLGVALACALLAPFFLDVRTWRSLQGEARFLAFSPAALLHVILWKTTGANGMELLPYVRMVMVPVFLTGYGLVLWRMRRWQGIVGLARACCAAVAVLLLVATWFGPWYVVYFVPLAALVPDRRVVTMTLVISVSVMLQYVPVSWWAWGNHVRTQAYSVGVAFGIPALTALALWLWGTRPSPFALLAAAFRRGAHVSGSGVHLTPVESLSETERGEVAAIGGN